MGLSGTKLWIVGESDDEDLFGRRFDVLLIALLGAGVVVVRCVRPVSMR